MSVYLFLALAAAPSVLAQTTVVTVPFYYFNSESIDASVVAVKNQATTLEYHCAPDVESNDCGLLPSQTLIFGPSTYHIDQINGTDFTFTQDCSPADATMAVCVESYGGSVYDGSSGSATNTWQGTDVLLNPITITAGASLLAGGTSGGSSTATNSGSSAAASTTAAAPGSSAGSSAAMATSSSGQSSTHSSAAGSSSTAGSGSASTSAAAQGTSSSASASATSSSNAAVLNVAKSAGSLAALGSAICFLQYFLF